MFELEQSEEKFNEPIGGIRQKEVQCEDDGRLWSRTKLGWWDGSRDMPLLYRVIELSADYQKFSALIEDALTLDSRIEIQIASDHVRAERESWEKRLRETIGMDESKYLDEVVGSLEVQAVELASELAEASDMQTRRKRQVLELSALSLDVYVNDVTLRRIVSPAAGISRSLLRLAAIACFVTFCSADHGGIGFAEDVVKNVLAVVAVASQSESGWTSNTTNQLKKKMGALSCTNLPPSIGSHLVKFLRINQSLIDLCDSAEAHFTALKAWTNLTNVMPCNCQPGDYLQLQTILADSPLKKSILGNPESVTAARGLWLRSNSFYDNSLNNIDQARLHDVHSSLQILHNLQNTLSSHIHSSAEHVDLLENNTIDVEAATGSTLQHIYSASLKVTRALTYKLGLTTGAAAGICGFFVLGPAGALIGGAIGTTVGAVSGNAMHGRRQSHLSAALPQNTIEHESQTPTDYSPTTGNKNGKATHGTTHGTTHDSIEDEERRKYNDRTTLIHLNNPHTLIGLSILPGTSYCRSS